MIELQAHEIMDFDISAWDKKYRSESFKQSIIKHRSKIVGQVQKYGIYLQTRSDLYGIDYILYAFEDNDPSKPFDYYCKLGTNSPRNGLFKPGVGIHTALVWRYWASDNLPNHFALRVFNDIIFRKVLKNIFISDKIKTVAGNKMLLNILQVMENNGWQLYIGLSDTDFKYVIPVTLRQFLAKKQTVYGRDNKGYRYRCIFAVKDETILDSILDHQTKVISFYSAYRLGLFSRPLDFLEDSDIDLEDRREYFKYNDQVRDLKLIWNCKNACH